MLIFVALIWAVSAVKISRKKFDEVKAMNLTEEVREDFRRYAYWYYDNYQSQSWWDNYQSATESGCYSNGHSSWGDCDYTEPTEVCAVDS